MSRPLRTPLFLAAVATAALALSGCGDRAPAAGTVSTTLDGEWQLVSSSFSSVEPALLDRTPVTLTVDGSEVAGRSACNAYSGTVETDGETVRFSGLGGTEMGCEPDVMALESTYLEGLQAVDRLSRRADQLTLSGSGVELVYEPVAAAVDKPFSATVWVLESLITGPAADDAQSSTAAAAYIRFDTDGTFTGSTGCGPIIGEWELVDGRVETTFGDLPVPPGDIRPSPCLPGATAQLGQVMHVLSGPFTATITGDLLTVTAADGTGLGYRGHAADPSDDGASEPAGDQSLDGTWLLLAGSVAGMPIALSDATIILSLADNEGETSTGCGTTAVRFDAEGSSIAVHLGPVPTDGDCRREPAAAAAAYLEALGTATAFERSGNRLLVSNDGVKLAFELITPTKPR